MKKKLITIVVSFFALFVLVGCGKAKQQEMSTADLQKELHSMENQYYSFMWQESQSSKLSDLISLEKKAKDSSKSINSSISKLKHNKKNKKLNRQIIAFGKDSKDSINVFTDAVKNKIKGKKFDEKEFEMNTGMSVLTALSDEKKINQDHHWKEPKSQKKVIDYINS
ncbi:hypothetical protein [Bombilactobacillus thymidiniphilus]|uniref:Lipoprotein n=1 Tax=Bombilactobacillus thymidiniphilus TaxID=2923363 RepID=A0ABY4PBR1_9LACO|nr:hypothetical protein [Bombilactobacillus thymidiniphilus]UQS83040.1 hypothetical protein MOO47_04450 [Bombilactobacillus thymidiniphilus]